MKIKYKLSTISMVFALCVFIVSTVYYPLFAEDTNQVQNSNKLMKPYTENYKKEIETIMELIPPPVDMLEEDFGDETSRGDGVSTKIYKSTDPTSDLVEDMSETEPAFDDYVIKKDELLKMHGKKSKIQVRSKSNTQADTVQAPHKNQFFPWLILILLIGSLILVFKFLFKFK